MHAKDHRLVGDQASGGLVRKSQVVVSGPHVSLYMHVRFFFPRSFANLLAFEKRTLRYLAVSHGS